MKKLVISIIMCFLVLTGCQNNDQRSDDIVVLFTNDIHSGIDENITLAGVASYKEYMKTKSKYVTLVDCGDAIQGNGVGLVSKGEVVIDAMNIVGYDYAILGNHAFDYGTEQLAYLINKSNAQYLNSNITYTGSLENKLAECKPYEIVEYGNKKVAYIGVTTPNTLFTTSINNLKEDNEVVYDFAGKNDGQDLYALVQGYVDEVKQKGADYVIVLAHLGVDEDDELVSYSADELINNTNGIDVVLDGHSHSVYLHHCVENKDGEYVVAGQTGTKLASLGQLVIDEKGLISISLVDDIVRVDDEVKNKIDEYLASYNALLDEVIAHSDFALSISDYQGVRMVRNRETSIGDFVSDAYRYTTGADISYVNGGGIKASIEAGDITTNDLIAVNPYGNTICVVEVTGQDIMDLLEYYCKDVQSEYVDAQGKAVGEQGSFPCMSGIHFVVNTSIPTSITVDEDDQLVSVGNSRRVSDIMVEENGEYVPIDPNKTYTLASHNYMIKQGGSGSGLYMANHNIVQDDIALDYEVLIYYLQNTLNYDLSSYENVDNRIIIK